MNEVGLRRFVVFTQCARTGDLCKAAPLLCSVAIFVVAGETPRWNVVRDASLAVCEDAGKDPSSLCDPISAWRHSGWVHCGHTCRTVANTRGCLIVRLQPRRRRGSLPTGDAVRQRHPVASSALCTTEHTRIGWKRQ